MSLLPSDSFLNKKNLDFNDFVIHNLEPRRASNKKVKRIVNSLAHFLQHNTGYEVRKLLKAGSLGKGTHINNKSDLDLVVFLNDFKDMKDFIERIDEVLENLKEKLKNWRYNEAIVEKVTKHAVQLNVKCALGDGSDLGIDILPAYDNLGHENSPSSIYLKMSKESSKNREFYSASLAELQQNFVIRQPGKLKNLIRLVKNWRKTHFSKLENDTSVSRRFPTSYVLELITIYAWQVGGKIRRFNYAKGFKAVMRLLSHPEEINISWNDNYGRELMAERKPNLPYILDPANPFNNVAKQFADTWEDVSKLAFASLQSPALLDVDDSNWHRGNQTVSVKPRRKKGKSKMNHPGFLNVSINT